MAMKATFRRDADLVSERTGLLRLRRRTMPRVLSIALVAAAVAIAVVDALLGRRWLAALHGLLALGFVWLLVRAEIDRFWFDGHDAVRRWLSFRGVAEERLVPASITRVGVARSGSRARCWIETKAGDEVALLEGDAEVVEAAADTLARAIRFADSKPTNQLLN